MLVNSQLFEELDISQLSLFHLLFGGVSLPFNDLLYRKLYFSLFHLHQGLI